MAKAYWVVCYRSIKNPDALAAYAKIAGPAIQAAGGRFLVRGTPAKTYERGLNQRTVVTEFDSLDKAIAAHDSAGYQEALRVLGDAVDRDMRIVEGVACATEFAPAPCRRAREGGSTAGEARRPRVASGRRARSAVARARPGPARPRRSDGCRDSSSGGPPRPSVRAHGGRRTR